MGGREGGGGEEGKRRRRKDERREKRRKNKKVVEEEEEEEGQGWSEGVREDGGRKLDKGGGEGGKSREGGREE